MRIVTLPLAALAFVVGCGSSSPPAATSAAVPSAGVPSTPASSHVTDTFSTKKGDLKVTPIFHASVLLEVAGQAVYVDPFSKGDFTGLPKADFVLITDIHQDHMDPPALDMVSKPTTRIVAPPAVAKSARRPRRSRPGRNRPRHFGPTPALLLTPCPAPRMRMHPE